MKKVLLVLAIAGMFITPMMPATKAKVIPPNPQNNGDIIFAEIEGWADFPSWDHTAIWDKNKVKILEADPHFENWSDNRAWWRPDHPTLGSIYPNGDTNYKILLKYLTYKSYHDRSWGKVEEDSITDIFYNYSKCAYGKLRWTSADPDEAIRFARDKINRPFDYVSPWYQIWGGIYSKQQDYPSNDKFFWNGTQYDLGKGYYCSELTWAAWKWAGINLDKDGYAVWPGELARNIHVKIYATYDLT
ncbi:MAG TPA: hypothetical protein ENL42_06850 [Thermoplasmatales archaeon]|nr:hypothetical protein [Thermoplasmatales archaeon]